MKKTILTALFLSLAITGCQKQQNEAPKTYDDTKTQFEKSDATISAYLDKLDSPSTSTKEKTKIVCKDYPNEYKQNYMPTLLLLSPEYKEVELLRDLDAALNYYKEKDLIKC